MRQPRYARKKRLLSEINVVPYIDVMLVLLVIFMITAPLLSSGVKVQLPQAVAKLDASENQQPFVVSVDVDGKFYLNDNQQAVVDNDALTQAVIAALKTNPRAPFLVRGDSAADYGNVVAAMVLLQQAGVESVGLITQPPDN